MNKLNDFNDIIEFSKEKIKEYFETLILTINYVNSNKVYEYVKLEGN